LLFQPLAGISLADSGCGSEARRSQWAIGECVVETEPIPQVDMQELEGTDRRPEQSLNEGVALL
jgi:hypothetical protein